MAKLKVKMLRPLFGDTIQQRVDTGFFNASDLVKSGNAWRSAHDLGVFNFSSWLRSKGVQEFLAELKSQEKVEPVIIRKRNPTWVHPFLFIKLALAINPKLEVEVMRWLYDELIKYRNNSADSYNMMCGALFRKMSPGEDRQSFLCEVAKAIRATMGVSDWQAASEFQLKLRDECHRQIASLVSAVPPRKAVNIALHVLREQVQPIKGFL